MASMVQIRYRCFVKADLNKRKRNKVVLAEVTSPVPHLLRAPRTTNTPINDQRMIPSELNDAMRVLSDCLIENTEYAMDRQGLTWASLSRTAGLSTSTIYPIKNRGNNVGTATAIQIAVSLGLDAKDSHRMYDNHNDFIKHFKPIEKSFAATFLSNATSVLNFHGIDWNDLETGIDFNLLKSGKKPIDIEIANTVAKSFFIETHETSNLFRKTEEFKAFYLARISQLSLNVSANIEYLIEKNKTSWTQLAKCADLSKTQASELKNKTACVGVKKILSISKCLGVDSESSIAMYFENSRFVRFYADFGSETKKKS